MKRKVLKGGLLLAMLIALMVGIPLYFSAYPDFRFFWSICTVLVTGAQLFFLIIGRKEKRAFHLKIALLLLLSVIMANDFYSYKTLSTVFPVLNEFTKSGLFGLGASIILLAAVCGGIYNTFHVLKKKQKEVIPDLAREMANAATAATYETLRQPRPKISYTNYIPSEKNWENSVDFSLQSHNNSSFRLHHIIGIATAIICIVLSAIVIFYALCKNRKFLMDLTNQGLPALTINLLFGFGVVLAAIFVVTVLAFYFIQMCYTIIHEMFAQRRLDIQNDSLLKCVSIFLTMCCFFFYRDATMKDLFSLVNGSNEAISLVIMILTFMTLTFVTLTVYKILKSLASPDGSLRNYTNKIFTMVITTIGDMIVNILEIASKAPVLLDLLLDATKKAFDLLWKILFDMEEDDFEKYSEEP